MALQVTMLGSKIFTHYASLFDRPCNCTNDMQIIARNLNYEISIRHLKKSMLSIPYLKKCFPSTYLHILQSIVIHALHAFKL